MMAVFEHNSFVDMVSTNIEALPYCVDSKHTLYETDFTDLKNLTNYIFFINEKGEFKYKLVNKNQKINWWKRFKFLFTGIL
jgi:hypothetical protein